MPRGSSLGEDVHRLTISVPGDVYAALSDEAEDENRPVSAVVRDALYLHYFDELRPNIGGLVEELLVRGLPNKQIAEAVRAQMPHSKTTKETVAFYRHRLRKRRDDIPTDYQARREL